MSLENLSLNDLYNFYEKIYEKNLNYDLLKNFNSKIFDYHPVSYEERVCAYICKVDKSQDFFAHQFRMAQIPFDLRPFMTPERVKLTVTIASRHGILNRLCDDKDVGKLAEQIYNILIMDEDYTELFFKFTEWKSESYLNIIQNRYPKKILEWLKSLHFKPSDNKFSLIRLLDEKEFNEYVQFLNSLPVNSLFIEACEKYKHLHKSYEPYIYVSIPELNEERNSNLRKNYLSYLKTLPKKSLAKIFEHVNDKRYILQYHDEELFNIVYPILEGDDKEIFDENIEIYWTKN